MNGEQVWGSFFGDECKGSLVRQALSLLVMSGVTPAECQEAVYRIEREVSIGPLLNPTAFLDGRRFDNAREYAETLRALGGLLRTLPGRVPADA